MAELFRDRVFAILASGIDAVAVTVQLSAGQGARFGTIPGGDFIRAALINSSGQIEIVKITARNVDQLTITRNAEGGGALSFVAGDRIECRIGPTSLQGFAQAAHLQTNEKKFGVNTGDANALVVTLPATTVIALVNGMEVDVELTGANTTTATLKVVLGITDTGVLPVVKNGPGPNLLPLGPGDLSGANAMAKFQYNADLASWVLLNPMADAALNREDQALTGGVIVTSKNLGTISAGTVTPDPGDRPQQHYVNGGAHTLAPSANVGSVLVDITNSASAGAITTSGFTFVTGDVPFTTTNGHKFRCHISIGAAGSLLQVQALQ